MKKINCIKKFLFCMTLGIIGLFILTDSVYAEVDCDKYACAVCSYYDDNTQLLITYTIKSDGTKVNVTFDTEYEVGAKPDNYNGITNNVPDATFTTTKNKLMCPIIYYVNNTAVYSDIGHGRTKLEPLSNMSTNNNKDVTKSDSTNTESKTNSCSFIDKNTNIKCVVTQRSDKSNPYAVKYDVQCDNGYPFISSKSNLKFLEGKDFSKCDEIEVSIFCDGGYYDGGCYINEPGSGNGFIGTIPDDGSSISGGSGASGDQVAESNRIPEYSCNYIGKVNNKSLIITKEKNSEIFIVKKDGKEEEISSYSQNFPTKDCEDVFYVINNGKSKYVKIVANTLHTDTQISQLCNGYGNEIEQFCEDGNCKIEKALCGNIMDTDSGEGLGCPWELRAIVVFLKRVVFNTVQLFVPIILIVMGTIDFTKAIASPDDKGNKEAISKFIKRCLAAIFVFFIGTIVSIVMNMFANTDVGEKNDWNTCWTSIK